MKHCSLLSSLCVHRRLDNLNLLSCHIIFCAFAVAHRISNIISWSCRWLYISIYCTAAQDNMCLEGPENGCWRQTGWECGSRIRLKETENDGNVFDLSQSPLPSYDQVQLRLLHTLLTLHTLWAYECVRMCGCTSVDHRWHYTAYKPPSPSALRKRW